uniref:FAD-binding PCMH-type domain-containing protein n=1 Tax=Compsopogon caeruleus TaxID=31354 RepID=A0A7S1XFA6_9RHOD|mmetsp:Transcript_2447/g.4235  ORF Transcript_2447/g.4235 Transcript_2447/m.4235 type:complete len:401 (+) Transcript_2447:356-1558(+)
MCSGIVVDLWQLRTFSVPRDRKSVTVGSGLTLGNFAYSLYTQAHGIFPTGHAPSVGITGYVLQGGLSELSNELGLGCDNLEEVRMIKSDGRRVIADATRNSNLLWASRGGGGGKFGIVYQMRLSVHPATRYDTFIGFKATLLNIQLIPRALQWLYQWQGGPHSILSRSKIHVQGGKSAVDFRILGSCLASVSTSDCTTRLQESGIFDFPWDDYSTIRGNSALEYLQFMAKGEITTSDFFLTGGVSHSDGSFRQKSFTYSGVGFNYTLSSTPPMTFFDDFFSHILQVCTQSVFSRCVVFIQNLDTGITGVDLNATAIFGLRRDRQWIGFQCTGATLQVAGKMLRDLRNHLSGYTIGSFLNWEDLGLADYKKAYWGDNAARLIKINRQCDPRSLFLSKQPLI